METRKVRMSITSPGGTSGKNAEGFRISIPTVWAREMGVSKEDRNVIISYENKRIIIEKDES